MKNIVILGAAGQIGQMLRQRLLTQPDVHLTSIARDAKRRLNADTTTQETVVSTDLNAIEHVVPALENQDIVILATSPDQQLAQSVVSAMQAANVKRLIVTGAIGVEHEVPGSFGQWNEAMGGGLLTRVMEGYQTIIASDLNYTYIRMTWLYDDPNQLAYVITEPGEPTAGVQVTREAVTEFIMTLIMNGAEAYQQASIGIYEPGSEKYDRPQFY